MLYSTLKKALRNLGAREHTEANRFGPGTSQRFWYLGDYALNVILTGDAWGEVRSVYQWSVRERGGPEYNDVMIGGRTYHYSGGGMADTRTLEGALGAISFARTPTDGRVRGPDGRSRPAGREVNVSFYPSRSGKTLGARVWRLGNSEDYGRGRGKGKHGIAIGDGRDDQPMLRGLLLGEVPDGVFLDWLYDRMGW